MPKKLIILFFLIMLAIAFQAQANEPPPETASASSIFRNNIITYQTPIEKDIALNATITPIIEPSVFEDCNEHPEKYDIYDSKKTVETAPCFSNTCWKESTILHGVSMQPTIYDGSTIYIRHDSRYNLSIGSIIAYDSLGQTVGMYSYNTIHRIVGIEPEYGAKLVRNGTKYNVIVPISSGYITYLWNSTHFLTNISEPFYVVKGDGNRGCELIPENAVHGTLVGVRA